jgi:ABC-type multidrug transport system fused ATPase/permease subunit
LDTKSLINPYKSGEKMCDDTFVGLIEFNEVWFRYPTRKYEWILRGLNLKILPK